MLINDPARFDGVRVIGIDEHVWRHTRKGDKYVTVIIDLTAIRDGTGPSRLLDMVEGRSKQAFASWLAEREQSWRDRVEVVAMDGFTGFKTATAEELPDAVAVMDPFYADVLVMSMSWRLDSSGFLLGWGTARRCRREGVDVTAQDVGGLPVQRGDAPPAAFPVARDVSATTPSIGMSRFIGRIGARQSVDASCSGRDPAR